MNIKGGQTGKTGKWGRYDRVRAAPADAGKEAETRPGSVIIEVWQISMKIDVNDWAVFDFLSCKNLNRESFDSVFRQDSYYVLKIHDF
jgi:hypothetical protein